MKEEKNYWTGMADFTTSQMPLNAIGIIARVVTYAKNYDEFYEKVRDINLNMGGELLVIEQSNTISDFLSKGMDKKHEIFEMLETAKRFPDDVVYGEFFYYTENDA